MPYLSEPTDRQGPDRQILTERQTGRQTDRVKTDRVQMDRVQTDSVQAE